MTPKPKSNDAELREQFIDGLREAFWGYQQVNPMAYTPASIEMAVQNFSNRLEQLLQANQDRLLDDIETKLAEAELRGQIKELRHSVIKGNIPDNVAALRRVLLEAQLQNLGGDNVR